MSINVASNRPAGLQQHKIFDLPEQVPFTQTQLLGFGAIGVVEEVVGKAKPFHGHIYARKSILLSSDKDREAALEEIEKEVKILKKVQHKHIVQLVMTYQLGIAYAIILDPRADGNLEQHFQKNTLESREKTSQWFGCLVNAIAYAHENGIRHRDIKPPNILIKDRNVLLTDFGISMMGLGKTVPTTVVNRPRARTLEYCAPEVESGHTRGRSADIFSLGAVFLEMLTTCTYPEKLEEYRAKMGGRFAKSLDIVPHWIDTLSQAPNSPPWNPQFLSIFQKMLQKDRTLRPVAGDLRTWWSHQSSPNLPPRGCNCALASANSKQYSDDMNRNLRRAYSSGHRLMVDWWLEKGARLSSSEALTAASEGGLWDYVESLLDHEADVNGKDNRGYTAIHAAASRGHKELVLMLLKRGADGEMKNNNNKTAVELAAINGHDEIVRLLLGS